MDWQKTTIGGIIGITLLGIAAFFYGNVLTPPGDYDEVYIAFPGLDKISPTHHQAKLAFTQCDNYILGPKNEEDPKFTTLSVRPDITAYLNSYGNPIRGLFRFYRQGGDDVLIMADSSAMYKEGTSWTTLESSLSDVPWEGLLYDDPSVSRLYLCNGKDKNKKYLSGQSKLFSMQNQDSETTLSGTIWFTYLTSQATGSATAIASLEAGRYIKNATTSADTLWNEVISFEGTTIKFNTLYTGTTSSYASVVRSNDSARSRFIVNYNGMVVLASEQISSTTLAPNTESSNYYQLDGAVGVAQTFKITKTDFTKIALSIWRGSGTTGNIILKVKKADGYPSGNIVDNTVVYGQISYPVASLSTSATKTWFDFGLTSIPSAETLLCLTVERENASTSPVYIKRGSAYGGGNSFWTYASAGFANGWNTGVSTIEVRPDTYDNNDGTAPGVDTYLRKDFPTGNFCDANYFYIGLDGDGTQYARGFIRYPIENKHIKNDYNNIYNVKFQMQGGAGGSLQAIGKWGTSLEAYRILVEADPITATWNLRKTGQSWNAVGCLGAGTDYNTTRAVVNAISTYYVTLEVSALAANWTKQLSNNYGIIVSFEAGTYDGDYPLYSFNTSSNAPGVQAGRPLWILTTLTGSTESSEDLYFDVQSDVLNESAINYSKRYSPENFLDLNKLTVQGRITGLAVSGSYLVVGVKNPVSGDNLVFYRDTQSNTDGEGIQSVGAATNLTFGSSKAIAYLPASDSFIFFSGLGVYRQAGTQSQLLSGQIKDEALDFTSNRDPGDYYSGSANLMPQAVVLPDKDTYLIAVPNSQGKNSFIYLYNYANGTWCRWTGLYPTAMLVKQGSNTQPELYLGYDTGQVYKLNASGSTTEATLEWYFGGKDITKDKRLDLIEFWGRADNPMLSCFATLEVSGVDTDTVSTSTFPLIDNTTTNKMVKLETNPGIISKEFKMRLTQVSTQGAVSWRSFRFKYHVY